MNPQAGTPALHPPDGSPPQHLFITALRTGIAALMLCVAVAANSIHAATQAAATPVLVDPRAVAVERFLGFGAEWDPQFWAGFNRKLGVTEQDWRIVVERIRWMRLPVVRMMMQVRWCTPRGDGQFDWGTPAMRSVYRHLDVCQRQGITVILTDWGCATWAKVPGFTGNDDPNYAQAIGVYLDYLLNRRGYSCIKYFILVNEPNFEGGGWEKWKRGVQNVAKVIADRKLGLTLVGTDESNDEAWHRRGVGQLADVLGAYDIHRYASQKDVRAGAFENYARDLRDYALSHDPQGNNKPFLVTEAGMADGSVGASTNRNIGTYDYGVFIADYAIQATRAGAAAVLPWMLDDSSHEHFRWGMWQDKSGGFALRPWFYPWSLFTRFVRPGSTLLRLESPSPDCRVLAARLPGRNARVGGGWTFCIVNRGDTERALKLRVPGGGRHRFRRYVYSRTAAAADVEGFPVPVDRRPADLEAGMQVTCPENAVVVLTTM